MVGPEVLVVDGSEGLEIALLSAEELYHLHADNVLLEVCVEARHEQPDGAEGIPDAGPEEEGDEGQRGQHRVGDEGELGRDEPQHHDDSQEHRNVGHDGHNSGGEHIAHRLGVAGQTRDQPSDRVSVEEAAVLALEVGEELPS